MRGMEPQEIHKENSFWGSTKDGFSKTSLSPFSHRRRIRNRLGKMSFMSELERASASLTHRLGRRKTRNTVDEDELSGYHILRICLHSVEGLKERHKSARRNAFFCKAYLSKSTMHRGSRASLRRMLASDNNDYAEMNHAKRASEGSSSIIPVRLVRTHSQSHLNGKITWNEHFQIPVLDPQVDILCIRVKSSNAISSPTIATCSIPISNLSLNQTLDQWFNLMDGKKDAGRIRLNMRFIFPGNSSNHSTRSEDFSSSFVKYNRALVYEPADPLEEELRSIKKPFSQNPTDNTSLKTMVNVSIGTREPRQSVFHQQKTLPPPPTTTWKHRIASDIPRRSTQNVMECFSPSNHSLIDQETYSAILNRISHNVLLEDDEQSGDDRSDRDSGHQDNVLMEEDDDEDNEITWIYAAQSSVPKKNAKTGRKGSQMVVNDHTQLPILEDVHFDVEEVDFCNY
ncbi:hypothetical protein ABG067_007452 [Albugo candida]